MHKNKGFSIVELGISIVIISLIAAVISVSAGLSKEATVRKLIAEIDQIRSAAGQFLSIYNYYPGDFPYASTNWCSATCAGATNNTANCVSDGGTAGYCNGNGDGIVDFGTPDATTNDEAMRFWQHLNLAGTYPGNLLGYHTVAWQNDIAGNTTNPPNVPGSSSGIAGLGYTTYQTILYSGGQNTAVAIIAGGFRSANLSNGSIIPPLTALEIDSKLDDGLPMFGKIRAEGATRSCLFVTSYYTLSGGGYGCSLQFVLY